jgi:lipopolysaccharide/colanic/teichoic acid biosynthesis glycosyltransferase
MTAVVSGVLVGVSRPRRALDVVVGAGAIVVLSPLMAAIAVAIRVDSAGPVLFRQTRVGAGGASFTMFKFRSMRRSTGGPEVTAPGDARITRVGHALRRTGLDELPQLLNVVRGQMTLVGPRPETPALASRYPPELATVFRYRPGLTGPAQIRLRDEDTLTDGAGDVQEYYLTKVVPRRVALDLEFQSRASLRSTVAVMAQTIAYLVH